MTLTPTRTLALTALAMVAFAANSVIGRLGLLGGDIGAGSFALIRLVSGALVLALLIGPARGWKAGDWRSALALFAYASFFSYAYLSIDAGAGALILFAVVQIVMVGAGLRRGERLSSLQVLGLALALGALGWWLWPAESSPALCGVAAMAVAGIGWGAYSFFGVGAGDPGQRTAGNFVRASLIALAIAPLVWFVAPEQRPGWTGAGYAVLSGAVTSGLGYVIWYAALRGLTAVRAGVAQLTVPVIAAAGGIALLSEPLTARFAVAATLILAGVALTSLAGRN